MLALMIPRTGSITTTFVTTTSQDSWVGTAFSPMPSRAVLANPVSSVKPSAYARPADADHQARVTRAGSRSPGWRHPDEVELGPGRHAAPPGPLTGSRSRNPVARARAMAASRAPGSSSGPSTSPEKPMMTRAPPKGTRVTCVGDAGIEARHGPRRDEQVSAVRAAAVEGQSRVDLEEVEVAAHRDRDVRGVGDPDRDRVRHVGTWLGQDATGQVRAGGTVAQVTAPDRVGHDDEAGPVVEHGFDLDLAHDVGDAGEDVVGTQHLLPGCECVRMSGPVPGRLADGVRDDRHRLRAR